MINPCCPICLVVGWAYENHPDRVFLTGGEVAVEYSANWDYPVGSGGVREGSRMAHSD